MKHVTQIQTDIVIIGGGIAGLWAMHTLKKQGYKVILLENNSFGSGQTIKSQGIIHGGLKYALSGKLNTASAALKDMPTYWQNCLAGHGDVDLRGVKVLSPSQYMWSIDKFTGGITSLFASSTLRGDVESVSKDQQPQIIRSSAINGKLYKLSEIVLNIPTLIAALAQPLLHDCIKIDSATFELDATANIKSVKAHSNQNELQISAQRYIFSAGTGNATLQQQLNPVEIMQKRPLHMILVKSANLTPLFGHCVSLSTAPRLTITTHIAKDHLPVWYLGGKLAEEGINIDSVQQIKNAQQELKAIFPDLDLRDAKWASFYVDRAEAKQADGSKPVSCSLLVQNNYLTAWPTKLALAPVLAQQILTELAAQNVKPNLQLSQPQLEQYSHPLVATPIWDELL